MALLLTASCTTSPLHCGTGHRTSSVRTNVAWLVVSVPSSCTQLHQLSNLCMYWFKVLNTKQHHSFCHSFSSDTAPVYLSYLLHVYFPSRQLISSSGSRTLRIPHMKTKPFGHHSFSYAASTVWNSLPCEIRHIHSTTTFKTALKTYMFKSYLCNLNLYPPPFSINYFGWLAV